MSAAEASKEKGLIVKGIVKGEPIYAVVSPGDYVRHRLMFPIELTEDLTVNFKKKKRSYFKIKVNNNSKMLKSSLCKCWG
jgi:hypothetical protein